MNIPEIVSQLTLEEKASLCSGGDFWHTKAIERLGIPAMMMCDGPHGLRKQNLVSDNMGINDSIPAVCFPAGCATASSFDRALVRQMGEALGNECQAEDVGVILGPAVNIKRSPLCGRNFEYYSEDPYVASQMASSFIQGVQSQNVGTSIKHFYANNQEHRRMSSSSELDERTAREIYLSAFETAIREAKPWTVMCSYNRINGVYAAENRWALTDVLRGEWGFDGFVVSDWGASYDVLSAIAAGTDLTMPGPLGIRNIVDAVNSGRLPEEKLDTAIRNILRVTLGSTAFTGKYPEFHLQEAYEAAEMAARESVVLLKNDGVLPLDKTTDVVFCGKRSKDFVLIPASVAASTDLGTNPYDRACELSGTEHVRYEVAGKETKYWIVTVGADACEGADRLTMDMDEDDRLELERALKEAEAAGGKLILIVNATGPVDLSAYESRVSAIVCPFFAGMMSGKVTADILFGLVNPSGHLPLTWPRHYYDCPSYKNYGGENKEVWHGEGIYVGYRWYDARHIRPLYPFGHGLSYTSFALSDLCVPESVRIDDEPLAVQVNVKNTGAMAGSEVVQLYVHDGACCYDRPEKELKAFCKVYLQPGEEKTVTLTLKKEDFAGWYADFGEWIVQPGRFELLLGISAEDIRLTASVRVRCRDPFGLSGRTAIGALVKDRQALEIVNRIMEDDMETLAAVALAYAPDKTLQELWNATNIHGALLRKGWDEEEIARRYAAIMEEFEELQARKI